METTVLKQGTSKIDKKLTDATRAESVIAAAMESINYKLQTATKDCESIASKREVDEFINNKLGALNNKSPITQTSYTKQTQNWIGHIIAVSETGFTARLDEIHKQGTFEIADFDYNDVLMADRPLVSLGSIFYWSVGYHVKGSQVYKGSSIRFQRLPIWNSAEFDKVADQASTFSNIKWD